MGSLIIDRSKCKQDGICAAVCPRLLIKAELNEFPQPTAEFADRCIRCGHCVAVCPTAALSLDGLGPEDCLELTRENAVSPAQAERFLRSRRSIRVFREEPASESQLEELVGMAVNSASASNGQPWRWIVIRDRDEVKRISGLAVDWMRKMVTADPVMAEAWGMAKLIADWETGLDRIGRNAPHLVYVHGDKNLHFGREDSALALSYLELYAPVLGLGACWVAYLYKPAVEYPPLIRALGIPEGDRVYGAVLVGKPKYKYPRAPKRKTPVISWK